MIRWVFRPLTQLWASICTSERPSDLHLIFTRLHPRRVKIIIFRVVSELISLRSFKKIRTGRMCRGSAPLPSHLLSLRIFWFFHQNTLNSDALLDPCFKTGYLTCETCYKSMRILVVEAPVWNPWSRHNFLSPNPSLKRNSSAPFEIRTFPGGGRAVWNRVVSERIFVPPFPAFFLTSSSPLSDNAQ